MIALLALLSALLSHNPPATAECMDALRVEVKAHRAITRAEAGVTYTISSGTWSDTTSTIRLKGPCDDVHPQSARYECFAAESRKDEERQAAEDAKTRKLRDEEIARAQALEDAIARTDEVCGAI